MNFRFAERAQNIRPSDIRELNKVVAAKKLISFGGGNPDASLFPEQELKKAMEAVLQKPATAYQYGITEGYTPLREYIAMEYMKNAGVSNATTEEVFITAGSQMGINLVTKALVDEGDTVVCERPTYSGLINATRPFRCKWTDIEMDAEGIRTDLLEEALKTDPRVKFIYTVPDFQNPSGGVMSMRRRAELLRLSETYRVPIIEDAPYAALCFGEKLPSLKSMDTTGSVIYLGSFSKVISPGVRIGWMCADKAIIRTTSILRQGVDLHSPVLNQMLVYNYLIENDVNAHISRLTAAYRAKSEIMIAGIRKHFPREVQMDDPKGGFFLWMQLREDIAIRDVLNRAMDQGVAFVPGGGFFANPGGSNCGRLNFISESPERIEKGVAALGEILRSLY